MIEMLMEVGPTMPGAMGIVPLSWAELGEWQRQTFRRLSAWEVKTLQRLSGVYLAELQAAEDLYRPAPWAAEPTQVDHAANERQLRAVLG